MSQPSLGDFLSLLQDAGELVRIAAPVDSALEIAEITRQVNREPDGGPALFFESVRGGALPVVTNVLGSRSRLCRALGVRSFEELPQRLGESPGEGSPAWLEAFKLSPFGSRNGTFVPKLVKQAPCQQIVKLGRDVNLWELPIPRSWPNERQPAITLGQIVTRSPSASQRAVELFPVQIVDQQRLALCWSQQTAAAQFWSAARAANQQLPVAIALGGHPANPLAALAVLPASVDPFCFCGLLHSMPMNIVKCRTNDLEVPAEAEIIIEGVLDPAAPEHPASPLALPAGFYSCRTDPLPVLQVTAVTHRANPVFPAQIFGPPPSEAAWMRLALERLFLPWLQAAVPELIDYHAPMFGGGRWLFARIRKSSPHQARTVLHALWGHPLTMRTKTIVVVDEDVDLHAPEHVWFAVASHVDPGRDLVVALGAADADDHATPRAGVGHQLGIDATRKLADEGHPRTWPDDLTMSPDIVRQVAERWPEFGIPLTREALS